MHSPWKTKEALLLSLLVINRLTLITTIFKLWALLYACFFSPSIFFIYYVNRASFLILCFCYLGGPDFLVVNDGTKLFLWKLKIRVFYLFLFCTRDIYLKTIFHRTRTCSFLMQDCLMLLVSMAQVDKGKFNKLRRKNRFIFK